MTANSDDVQPMTPEQQSWYERMRAKIDACPVMVSVGGQTIPLKDCDWVLRESCGCVSSIMHAVTGDETHTDAQSAWHVMYDSEPHRLKKVREAGIKKRKAEGATVELMTIHDAVDAFKAPCTHTLGNRQVEDTPGI